MAGLENVTFFGGGGGPLSIPAKYIFTGADKAACETARDAYFTANPSELKKDVNVVLKPADGSGPYLQQYNGTSWVDISTVIQGPAGKDGNDGKNFAYKSKHENASFSVGTSNYTDYANAITTYSGSSDGVATLNNGTADSTVWAESNIYIFRNVSNHLLTINSPAGRLLDDGSSSVSLKKGESLMIQGTTAFGSRVIIKALDSIHGLAKFFQDGSLVLESDEVDFSGNVTEVSSIAGQASVVTRADPLYFTHITNTDILDLNDAVWGNLVANGKYYFGGNTANLVNPPAGLKGTGAFTCLVDSILETDTAAAICRQKISFSFSGSSPEVFERDGSSFANAVSGGWSSLSSQGVTINGFKDGGRIQQSDDPKTKDTGAYYVTEKFIGAPALPSGDYTGMMLIQADIDHGNGGQIIYFNSEGMFSLTKYAGGWDSNWDHANGLNPSPIPTSIGPHFIGFYDDVADLNSSVKTPPDNYQAIVIKPVNKYYHAVGGTWVELAEVGDIHPTYIGAYDDLNSLKAAHPNPYPESISIVGDTSRIFYIYMDGKWEPITHSDIPSLDARVGALETTSKSNKNRVDVAEGHIQTLQTDAQGVDYDIRQLQGQVYTGNDIQDDQGNSLSDITGLKFVGAEVSDDDGDQTATVTVKPKITVANGQQPDSTALTGNAIILEGANIEADPNDPDVLKVDMAHGGINIGDGVNASREVTTLLFNGHQAYGVGNTAEIHLEFAHFKTMSERDSWSAKFGSRMSYDVIALVDDDGNGFVAYYKFDASKKSWVEYDAQGVVMSDSNGAIPKNIKTVVFGNGFDVQQAGDQEDAALVTYSGDTGIDGITIDGAKYAEFNTGPFLEMNSRTNPTQLTIKPATFEPMHKPSFLAYVSETEEVVGKSTDAAKGHHDGAIWFGDVIQPAGAYIQFDRDNKAYGLQEADDLDPNVSGGTNYLVVMRIAMKGKAPSDGIVRAYLYDKSINPFSDTGYLKDVNDQIMGYQRSYKIGEELGTIEVAGVVNAKGLKEFTCHVTDSFIDDMLNIEDRTEGGSCLMIQAITSEGKTGDGLQQFEIDTQQNIEFSSHYLGVDRSSLDWIVSRNMPEQTGNAGAGMTMADGYHFYNIAQMKTSINGGHLNFMDNGADIADFNFGRIFSAEETQMLRGKTIHVTVTLTDKDSGWEVALMKWAGTPDEYTPEIYKSRDGGGSPILQTGWSKGDSFFISEDVTIGDHTMSKVFTVPADANNYAVIIYPVEAQQPLTLKLKQLKVDVNPAFIGFALHAPQLANEAHLYEDQEYREFTQDNQGFASLRYTINNKPTPMPVGIPVAGKGIADIAIDPKVNPVSGSGAKGGEGALTFSADGEVSLSSEYKVFAGESVPKGTERNVRFWWATYSPDDQQFTEIPDSDVDVKVTGGDTIPMSVAIPAFDIQVENGEKIAAFAQADIADGAYVQCHDSRSPIVSNHINFKELKAGGSDTTDLISAPLSKSLVVDRRYYEFTGNSAQNIDIADLDIPADAMLKGVTVEKVTPSGFSSEQAEHAYNESAQTLTVHVSGAAAGTVFLEFWSKQ